MGKKTKPITEPKVEATAAVEAEATKAPFESGPLPGETHGLAVTAPVEPAPVLEEPFDDDEDFEEQPLTVDPNVSSDPYATIAAAFVAIGKIYNQSEVVSDALTKHLRETSGEPELQGFLQRMQTLLGEFRHAVDSVESTVSEGLYDAIMQGVA